MFTGASGPSRRMRIASVPTSSVAPASRSLSMTASSVSGCVPTSVASPPAGGDRREKGARLDPVGHDRVRCAVQARYAFDRDPCRAGAVDARAHRREAACEIHDLGLTRGVLERRRPLGECRRHHQILGAGDRDEVEREAHAGQARGARADVAILQVDVHTHRLQALDVLIDRPQPDRASAGERDARFAATRDQRSERENRGAHRLHELVRRERPVDLRRIERGGAGGRRVDGDAHLREQPLHRPHVVQARKIGERQRLGSEQRCAKNRQRRVLRAGNANLTGERPAAFDHQLVHFSAHAHPPKVFARGSTRATPLRRPLRGVSVSIDSAWISSRIRSPSAA
jgi:hypothetical protein